LYSWSKALAPDFVLSILRSHDARRRRLMTRFLFAIGLGHRTVKSHLMLASRQTAHVDSLIVNLKRFRSEKTAVIYSRFQLPYLARIALKPRADWPATSNPRKALCTGGRGMASRVNFLLRITRTFVAIRIRNTRALFDASR
jgi:hypothetical protein